MNRETIIGASRQELLELLKGGFAIDPEALADTRYFGISLGLPAWIDKVAWKTFRKVFHRDPGDGALRGWNVKLQQEGLDLPGTPKLRKGAMKSFGHYKVRPLEGYPTKDGLERGLMLDYGLGRNRRFRPSNLVRDPLVALVDGDTTFLLGRSYLKLGRGLRPTRSYFLLEREGELQDVINPPRP
jgi:hypothetical protein